MADKVDFVLDIRGESCPYPVIYTLDALKEMKAGQILQVVADCPQSFRNVPEEAVKHGYELMGEPQKSGQDIYFTFRVNA